MISKTKVMRNLIPIILVVIALFSQKLNAQNAPVTTAGTVVSNANVIVVPITAAGFNNIGSCNLRLLYDPAIVSAIEVSMPPVMGEFLDYNVNTPGIITWGWFFPGGITLPDNSIIFNISFEPEADAGSTALVWDDSTPYFCTWSNANSVVLLDQPNSVYYISGNITIPTAPQTIAPDEQALPNTEVEIPITVIGFQNVGVVSLTLLFDPLVLTLTGYANNSGFPGLQVDNPEAGMIKIGGFSAYSGITLIDFSTFVTLEFEFHGGYSALTWFDDGPSCEYGGYPDYNAYVDIPTASFYINGSVSELPHRILDVKVFLESLYNGGNGNMNKTKDIVGGLIVDKFPGTIADLIEINLFEVDGFFSGPVYSVTDVELNQDGTATILVPISFNENYYVTIVTRNHLETVTSATLDFSGDNVSWDFTTSASNAYGDNQAQIDFGVYGLFVGDINLDGFIDINDTGPVNTSIRIGSTGYTPSDVNGDAVVDINDAGPINTNIRMGITRVIP